jgi:hypothetical protein
VGAAATAAQVKLLLHLFPLLCLLLLLLLLLSRLPEYLAQYPGVLLLLLLLLLLRASGVCRCACVPPSQLPGTPWSSTCM